jgi:Ig-like domain from next to BRCA1 gene
MMRRLLLPAFAVACFLGALACDDGSEKPSSPAPPAATPAAAPRVTNPLPPSGFKLEWSRPEVPGSVAAGSTTLVNVTVKNTSDQSWPDARLADPGRVSGGAGAVRLSYRWIPAGHDSEFNAYKGFDSRTELPKSVAPGESVTVAVPVKAPGQPGNYNLQFDLVQELVDWFGTRSNARLVVPVAVR